MKIRYGNRGRRARFKASLELKPHLSELPQLRGSKKQVAWAEDIRACFLDWVLHPGRLFNEGSLYSFEEWKETVTKGPTWAAWWIDRRTLSLDTMYEELVGAVAVEKAEESNDGEEPGGVAVEAMIEATVRPENRITELVAEICVHNEKLVVRYPQPNEELQAILKGRRFQWDKANRWWWRKVDPETSGTLDERAAELGHLLLSEGFPVRIYDENLRAAAIEGRYEPEHFRWVGRIATRDGVPAFSLVWQRNDDLYEEARKIPGARYDKAAHCIVVPTEEYEAVEEFAEIHNFRFTKAARTLLAEAGEIRRKMLIVNIKKPVANVPRRCGVRPVLVPDQNPQVDDDLRDA